MAFPFPKSSARVERSFAQIGNGPDRFALSRDPDGVYRIEGRVIPVRDDGAKRFRAVDHSEAVVPIERRLNKVERLDWGMLGVNANSEY